MSTWKVPCTLPGNCALCIVICFVFVFLGISVSVVHIFNTFQWFVLASIGYEGCCKWTSTPLYDLLFSTWSVFFWYTFVFVIAAKNAITYGLVFVYVVLTILCSYSLSGWSTEVFLLSLKSWTLFLCHQPFWHLSTRYKAQSLLPCIGISRYS